MRSASNSAENVWSLFREEELRLWSGLAVAMAEEGSSYLEKKGTITVCELLSDRPLRRIAANSHANTTSLKRR